MSEGYVYNTIVNCASCSLAQEIYRPVRPGINCASCSLASLIVLGVGVDQYI